MTEESSIADGGDARLDPSAFRDAEDNLNPLWIERLREHLLAGEEPDVADMMEPLHAADAGDVLEALEADERLKLVQMLGDKFDYEALTEVDENVRSDLMDELPTDEIARGVSTLDSDDAVYILEDIDVGDREEILAQLPAFERLSLKRSLDFPEEFRRAADADGLHRHSAVLDRRPDHRLSARRKGAARRVLPALRRRSELPRAGDHPPRQVSPRQARRCTSKTS